MLHVPGRKPSMRPRLATLPYPIDPPREKQDTLPFDLCRVKPSDAGAGARVIKPRVPPRPARVAVGGLPSVVVEDPPDHASRPPRPWL
jgi:hypothetical protein